MTERKVVPEAEELLDPLSINRKAEIVAASYYELSEQLFALEVLQVSNGHKDSDLIPAPGQPQTYRERRKKVEEAMGRIREMNRERWDNVKEAFNSIEAQRQPSMNGMGGMMRPG